MAALEIQSPNPLQDVESPLELQALLDENLSTQEVVYNLRQYHSLPQQIDSDDRDKDEPSQEPSWSDIWKGEYWDTSLPLAKCLGAYWLAQQSLPWEPVAPSDPLANIRKKLRGRITAWLCNAQRKKNIFWIFDPLLSSKSWVLGDHPSSYTARIWTGITRQTNQFGAYIHYVSPWGVGGLVIELAKACPQYRSLVIRVLLDYPLLHWDTLRARFKKLIIEPWEVIRVSYPHYLSKPLLIIVDIYDDDYQDPVPSKILDEFIELIRGYSQSRQNSPLLWLFCSRPEQGLRRLVPAAYPFWCELWRVSLDDAEVHRDTRYLLDEGFRKIRSGHNIDDTEPWPSEEQLSMLTKAISGVYYFTDAVLKFIDCGRGEPRDQVDACLKYMDGIPGPSASVPFRTVDYFYDQFISDLPSSIQSDASRILNVLGNSSAFGRFNHRPIAHVLGMDQSRFCHALDGFHPVLQIPSPDSFFYEVRSQSAEAGSFLGFLERRYFGSAHSLQPFFRVLDSYPTIFSALNAMRWTSSQLVFRSVSQLINVAKSMGWLSKLLDHGNPVDPAVYDLIRDFDFRHIVPGPGAGPMFRNSLKWLFTHRTHLPDIVRTDAKYATDHQLIEKCEGVAIPLELRGYPNPPPYKRISFDPPKYALLGYGVQTVLIIFCYGGFGTWPIIASFYSLEMLDDM